MGEGRSLAAVAADECAPTRAGVTVIVPAYNDAASIAETIESLQRQALPPVEIIVVDDSDDGTGELASALGATVLRPASNAGSKAGAQTFALRAVSTELVMAVDADTALAPDAIETPIEPVADSGVAAASGYALPRPVKTLWQRGRYIEYLFEFSFFKQIQDYLREAAHLHACFSVHRTNVLRNLGGWSTRTSRLEGEVRTRRGVLPDRAAQPWVHAEALRPWSHGFVQNMRLHWQGVLQLGYLRSLIAVACYDALFASLAFVVLLPIPAIVFHAALPARVRPRRAGRDHPRGARRRRPGRAATCARELSVLLRPACAQRGNDPEGDVARRSDAPSAPRLRKGPLMTLRGWSNLTRWRIVLRNVAIATAMVATVTAVVWLVHRLAYPPAPADHADGQNGSRGTAHQLVPFTPVLFSLAVLVTVLSAAFVLRLVAGRKRTDLSEPSRAEAPAGQSPD